MKTIEITIEASKDLYGLYAENTDAPFWGSGKTLEEAKESLVTTISLFKEANPQENWPEALKSEYDFVYKWDVKSFLEHNKGVLSQSAIGRVAGISPKMLQHYSSGEKKPGAEQKKKLALALHQLGQDLLAVRF